jgi:hypothetical protein
VLVTVEVDILELVVEEEEDGLVLPPSVVTDNTVMEGMVAKLFVVVTARLSLEFESSVSVEFREDVVEFAGRSAAAAAAGCRLDVLLCAAKSLTK